MHDFIGTRDACHLLPFLAGRVEKGFPRQHFAAAGLSYPLGDMKKTAPVRVF
jgi:hypothetical protein